jgi:AcrR family transcriptional regulator
MSNPSQTTHRDALLDAARVLLRDRGYGNITARDLVAASNTNLGSIGYHFGSKEALLNEATGQALEAWAETIAGATRADPDAAPVERLISSWRAVLDGFEQNRPYFLAFIEALPRSARSPELTQQLAAHYERQRERVVRTVAETLGDVLDAEEARHYATFLIAIIDGLMLQSFVDHDNMPTSAELGIATGKVIAAALAHPAMASDSAAAPD